MSDVVAELDEAAGIPVTGAIAAGRGAVSGIAVSPDGARLMTTHYGDDSVSLIDTANGAVALTVIDVDEPFAVAMVSREPCLRQQRVGGA